MKYFMLYRVGRGYVVMKMKCVIKLEIEMDAVELCDVHEKRS